MANTLTLSEFKNILNYFIDNNKRLEDEGKKTTAIGIEGEAGIGKTAIIREVALERGMTFVKFNLAQIEEVGD